jgi:pectinesterase
VATRRIGLGVLVAVLSASINASPPAMVAPDLVVAGDGSGHFTSVHAALQSIPRHNRERRIVFVKNGIYRERVRVDAAYVTLRGESRSHTRIEFAHPASAPQDEKGRAVLDIGPNAHDFVLENLTIENTHGVIGVHAFAILGLADRTILQDANVLSLGNDTLALWRGRPENAAEVAAAVPPGDSSVLRDGGRYYHARLAVRGSVDFVCPRGWCYLTDSTLTQMNPKATAALWHDGRNDPDKKFVIRNTRFDGPPNWTLARRHHDGLFYFIACLFSRNMRDQPPHRVVYPLDGGTPTEADRERNRQYDLTNRFGNRAYYAGSRREGGDYAWHRDNLASAPGAPTPEQVTAKWTFAGTWDPERTDAPSIVSVRVRDGAMELEFSENVTVKGLPLLVFADGATAAYQSGSGARTLAFARPAGAKAVRPMRLDLRGGAILATEATTAPRLANLSVPAPAAR